MVRVETWFDNGDTPRAGDVEVSGALDQVLIKGRLSSQGLFLFDAPEGQPLQVVVEAGEGHRAEVALQPGDLLMAGATAQSEPTLPRPTTPAVHAEPWPIKDVLFGIGLLLAVAAFVLSVRNARTLREMRRPGDARGAPSRRS